MTGRRFASRFPRDTRGLAGALIAAAVLVAGALPMAGAAGRVTYRVGEAPPAEAGRLLPLYRGTRTRVTVERPSVERCDRVEPGAGVSVPGGRLERAPGRLAFEAVVDAGAPLGSRDLKLRYAIELAGPEVVPARVLRGGLVEGVEPRRVVSGRPVVLTFSGRDLGDSAAAVFVRPSPFNPDRLVLVRMGTGAAECRLAASWGFVYSGAGMPDFVVFDKRYRRWGWAGVRAAGFFDPYWRVDDRSAFYER